MNNKNQHHREVKELRYVSLEKNFIRYADLTMVSVLDISYDKEPFVTLSSYGKGLIGKYVVKYDIETLQNQNIFVRKSVFDKLQKVDVALKRKKSFENCQLVVVYGYRSFEVQQHLFNEEREKIKLMNPNMEESELTEVTHRKVAVPVVAGHPTGGAVDVIIYDFENEKYLDFGTEVRDFTTKDSYYNSPFITKTQKSNRRLLRKIMTEEGGFAPYNGEWWHFSYGDKEWAYYTYLQMSRASDKKKRTANNASRDSKKIDLKYLYAQKSPSELVYTEKYLDSAVVTQDDLVRLAIQKSGRLTDETIKILTRSGIDLAYDKGKIFGKCSNFPLEMLFVRDDDISSLVDAGAADIGIVGENIYNECDGQSEVLIKLGFGRCSLAVAIPEVSAIQTIFDLTNKKVATSYKRSAEKFFAKEGIKNVQIVDLAGSVEMATTIGYADAIVDLVSTGSSLRQNNLKVLHKIFDSESILIANKDSLCNQYKRETIDRLKARIVGSLEAKKYKFVMFSVSAHRIERITSILLSAKLVSKSESLDCTQSVIIRAVVNKRSIWEIVEALHDSNAKDIVFYDIETIS